MFKKYRLFMIELEINSQSSQIIFKILKNQFECFFERYFSKKPDILDWNLLRLE